MRRSLSEVTIRYENTVPAAFVRRINRFTAEVEMESEPGSGDEGHGSSDADKGPGPAGGAGKQPVIVHVKNTGRLGELLLPGAQVTLQRAGAGNAAGPSGDGSASGTAGTASITGAAARKTAYDLISVYKPDLGWVNIDSLVPNRLMKQYLLTLDYDLVRPEFTYGDSRFDFYMERGGEKYLTEVKGCTLAAEPEEDAATAGAMTNAMINTTADGDGNRRIGLFPDAPTERGVKHLHELAAAAGQGYHCSIAFVIQMNGIHTVLPNNATQPAFGRALAEAQKAGVKVEYYGCRVEADRITLEAVRP